MNKVMLIGNVGKDPEVRYVDHGMAVARLSLATTERGYTLQNGTQVPDHTDWHNVILWRKLAEIVEKYVHKGDKLYIEGRIRYTSYNDKQGVRRNMTEIWADNMEMLTPKTAATNITNPTDTKLSQADTKLTQADTKLNQADTKLNQADTKLNQADTKLNQADTKPQSTAFDTKDLPF